MGSQGFILVTNFTTRAEVNASACSMAYVAQAFYILTRRGLNDPDGSVPYNFLSFDLLEVL